GIEKVGFSFWGLSIKKKGRRSMRKLPFLRFLPIPMVFSVVVVLSGVLGIDKSFSAQKGGAQAQAITCPVIPDCPTCIVARGSQCLLTKDWTLSQAIEPSSFTHFNCQGHKLTPAVPGTGATATSYSRSVPEMAILLYSVDGVKVQNCVIG